MMDWFSLSVTLFYVRRFFFCLLLLRGTRRDIMNKRRNYFYLKKRAPAPFSTRIPHEPKPQIVRARIKFALAPPAGDVAGTIILRCSPMIRLSTSRPV